MDGHNSDIIINIPNIYIMITKSGFFTANRGDIFDLNCPNVKKKKLHPKHNLYTYITLPWTIFDLLNTF